MINGAEQKEVNVPRILLEFLVYGTNDKETKQSSKVIAICDEIQKQISKARANRHKTRILWYSDSGEKTDSEKELWLIDKAKCKYYVIINYNNIVSKTLVKDTLSKIKSFERVVSSMKASNVCIAKRDKSDIENAKIIEIATENK